MLQLLFQNILILNLLIILVSEPGKIEKFSNFKFSYKLYELSFTPIICSGNFLTSSSTQSILNLYPLIFQNYKE